MGSGQVLELGCSIPGYTTWKAIKLWTVGQPLCLGVVRGQLAGGCVGDGCWSINDCIAAIRIVIIALLFPFSSSVLVFISVHKFYFVSGSLPHPT